MRLGLNNISYEERLDKLGLFTLDHWRLKASLIEVYKILRSLDRWPEHFFLPWWKCQRLYSIGLR